MFDTHTYTTFTIVFLVSALLLAFADNVIWFIKKIISFQVVRLSALLLLASSVNELFEDKIHQGLLFLGQSFHSIAETFALSLPFPSGFLYVVHFLFLFAIASTPGFIFFWHAKHKFLDTVPIYIYYIGALLWILAVFLLTMT